MSDMVKVKVTSSGQVSIPAAIRRRWEASELWVIDEGHQVIVRPVPDDPVAALRGKYRYRRPPGGPSFDELWRQADEEDAEIEARHDRR